MVSPAEHLRHPSVDDVREGVIASRIAAHSADIVKGVKGALSWDREMSLARKKGIGINRYPCQLTRKEPGNIAIALNRKSRMSALCAVSFVR